MYEFGKVSADEALRLISKAIELAQKINKHIAVAVTGPEGELISFLRMDGANPASAQIAQSKAYTSARDCKSTRAQGEFMRNDKREQGYWTDSRITGFGGGLHIVQHGKVIGGIGVSGLSEEEDERIAREAIESVYSN
ncbi:MAG TPA: heme-binding protein [Cyclobacteriaceae bacterium]|nr:heme-binding protein [Cyclobacteriaceae bacterium]